MLEVSLNLQGGIAMKHKLEVRTSHGFVLFRALFSINFYFKYIKNLPLGYFSFKFSKERMFMDNLLPSAVPQTYCLSGGTTVQGRKPLIAYEFLYFMVIYSQCIIPCGLHHYHFMLSCIPQISSFLLHYFL